VVVSRQHRLAGRTSIRVGDLRNDMWAIDLANHAFSSVIVGACRDAGFEPAINGYSSNLDVLLALVKRGCSVSMLPGFSVQPHRKELRVLKLNPPIRRKISAACRKHARQRPATAAMISQLQACALKLGV
jgi:DNA-binding transcriptional LysR family regulator